MNTLRSYLLISLLCHLVILLLLQIPRDYAPTPMLAEPIWIDIQKGKYEVVDIQPPKMEERPEDAEFLGLYDTRADQERVAVTPSERTMDRGPKTEDQKEKDRFSHSTVNGLRSTVPDVFPDDFFPDFRRGPHTYLNVLRFPDIQYFVRLKRAFKLTFNPLSPLREAYFHNRITRGKIETVLGVSIDKGGNLSELFVIQESGLQTYDEEALRTIRASAPFSTPPVKLLDKEGLLRMSWTFTVYL